MTGLELLGPLADACYRGDTAEIAALAKKGADVNMASPHDRRTPLHWAAAGGKVEAVRALLKLGAKQAADHNGQLPFHDAKQLGHEAAAQALQETAMPSSLADEPLEARVLALVHKEGAFARQTVEEETRDFFNLGWHQHYFEMFQPAGIARHVLAFIAARKLSLIQQSPFQVVVERDDMDVYLTTTADAQAWRSMTRRVSEQAAKVVAQGVGYELMFMEGQNAKVGLYVLEKYPVQKNVEQYVDEANLDIVSSETFLRATSKESLRIYQEVMNRCVLAKSAVVGLYEGSQLPGPFPSGYVVFFADYSTQQPPHNYIVEVNQCFRHLNLNPLRYHVHTFANGITTYALYYPFAQREEMDRLIDDLRIFCFLKRTEGLSGVVTEQLQRGELSPHEAVYALSLAKFGTHFFPKEELLKGYLELSIDDQGKLAGLVSVTRIYHVLARNAAFVRALYQDFQAIALGQAKPQLNQALSAEIAQLAEDATEAALLRTFLLFNAGLRLTNWFKLGAFEDHGQAVRWGITPAALAFRFDPKVILQNRHQAFPQMPFGIWLVCGRRFHGFHVRFREISRGGIRMILSRDVKTYEKNQRSLFDENYNLAFTQQQKNKDIPEGGSKGTILLDSNLGSPTLQTSASGKRDCFIRYIDSLLDCMMAEKNGLYTGHLPDREFLFFGPDENTADYMDLGALRANHRGYEYWKALTTGKSPRLGGIPHDTYGMTTSSVHQMVLGLLRETKVQEEAITKFQTGGPDGDLGSNEILMSKDKTIGLVDGSGVLYDPNGLDRGELTRLAKGRKMCEHFDRGRLGPQGFLVKIGDRNVSLPDGTQVESGLALRDTFHLSRYAQADLLVPCGGRPGAINASNVHQLFVGGKCKFRYIVEGANLFITQGARDILEEAGVHLIRDASANKGGVTSSSLEVLAAMALPEDLHDQHMCVKPGQPAPDFYQRYVQEVVASVKGFADKEFQVIWDENQARGVPKTTMTTVLSQKINLITDTGLANLQAGTPLFRFIMAQAIPKLLLDAVGLDACLERLPLAYQKSLASVWLAGTYVYSKGVQVSDFDFYAFMQSLHARL